VGELSIVNRASDNTIGRTLKNVLEPHLKKPFVIPPESSAAFVANIEDKQDIYHREHDPECPVVCLDETSKQLITETRVPVPAEPWRVARYDYEYARTGTANLFVLFAPLEGWRHVAVTDRRTAKDFAHILTELSDTHVPGASKIALVQDNLPPRCLKWIVTSHPLAHREFPCSAERRFLVPA